MKGFGKKAAAVVLTGLLCASALPGCKNQTGVNDPQATGKVHKISMLTSNNNNANIKFADRENFDSWQVFKKWLQTKNLDVTFEVIPADQYQVVIQTRMASGADLPDIVNITPLDMTTSLNLAKQGTILPLNKLLGKYGDGSVEKFWKEQAPFIPKLTTASDGNIYWVTGVQKTTYQGKLASTCQTIEIRKDWLDKLNLKTPETAQEFESTMLAFRNSDVNGNGAKDEVLAVDPAGFLTGIAQWFGLSPQLVSLDPVTNKITSPWYQKGAKDYFKYLNALVKDGVLDTSLFGATSGSPQSQKISENKVGALVSYAMQTWYEPTVKTSSGTAEYAPIGPLTAVSGITPVSATEASTMTMGLKFAVTKNCKDQQGVAKLLEIFYSNDYETLVSYGIEGKEFKTVNGIREFQTGYTGSDDKLMAQKGECPLDRLVNGTFPRVRFAQMETSINSPSLQASKSSYQKKVINYSPAVTYDSTSYLALPDADQLAKQTEINTNLTTYSAELATKLALGQYSLDNWDQYMAQLKKLGLDDLIAIDQKLYDRYNSTK